MRLGKLVKRKCLVDFRNYLEINYLFFGWLVVFFEFFFLYGRFVWLFIFSLFALVGWGRRVTLVFRNILF